MDLGPLGPWALGPWAWGHGPFAHDPGALTMGLGPKGLGPMGLGPMDLGHMGLGPGQGPWVRAWLWLWPGPHLSSDPRLCLLLFFALTLLGGDPRNSEK